MSWLLKLQMSFSFKRIVVEKRLHNSRNRLSRSYRRGESQIEILDSGAGEFAADIAADAALMYRNSKPIKLCCFATKHNQQQKASDDIGRYFIVEYENTTIRLFYLGFAAMDAAWFELPRLQYVSVSEYPEPSYLFSPSSLAVYNVPARTALIERLSAKVRKVSRVLPNVT